MEKIQRETNSLTYLLDRGVMVTVRGVDINVAPSWDVSILDINTSAVEELKGQPTYKVLEILSS